MCILFQGLEGLFGLVVSRRFKVDASLGEHAAILLADERESRKRTDSTIVRSDTIIIIDEG